MQELLESYPNLAEIMWVQEEPKNMGAWSHGQIWLDELIRGCWPLHYLGRPASSSPAEGSAAWHAVNQKALIEQAYNLESNLVKEDAVLLEQT
jgi:2-oxoglutarate dehydrogenase E1 component